jgi:nickel-dependent lactate racemase
MPGYKLPALKPQEIRAAVTNLMGLAPIRELARGKKEVVIIFDDMSRVTRTAQIVPFVLEELALAGIPDNKIRFICALGNHGASTRVDFAKKLGEDVVARFPVYNHNPFFNCSYVGTTSAGTKVHINDEVLKCDFKVAIGSVVPHPTTGFGGGGKIILPGVASIETAQAFHLVPMRARMEKWAKSAGGMGVFDNNPALQNVDEAAGLAGLDVKIDCLVNMWGETTAIFAGALGPTYAAAIDRAKSHYRTRRTEDENIVIANTFAKANEGVMIGLDTAASALNGRGGDVVVIANAPDGQVTHYLMGPFGQTSAGALRLLVRIPQHVNHAIVYSEYPDLAGQGYVEKSDKVLFMNEWSQVVQALREFHGDKAKVAVYPNAEIQYCAP